MSHILAQWLNNEVRLSKQIPPPELDSLFSSGYLLGELLHRYDLQDDFSSSFARSDTLEGAIRNYTLLEKTLREKLGIRISSNAAYDLIRGRSGCAAKLLYQIKTSLAGRLPPLPSQDKGVQNAGGKRKKASDAEKNEDARLISYPNSPTGERPLHSNIVIPELSQKKRFIDKEHQFFAEMLKAKLRRSNRESHHTEDLNQQSPKPDLIYDGARRGRGRAAQAAEAADSPTREGRKGASSARAPKMDEKPMDISVESAAAVPAASHAGNQRLQDAKRERDRKHKERRRQLAAEALCSDIQDFEKHLEIAAPASRNLSNEDIELMDPKEIKRFIALKAPMDTVNHVKMLSSFLPGLETAQKHTREYLEKIRLRKLEEEASRKEREQRRRKIILGQQHAQEELEKSHLEDIVLSKLMRQSKQERRIAEQLMQVRHEKAVMTENRMFREQQYAQRRQRDYEDALAREYELCEQARQEYAKRTELQMMQHREILAEKAAAKHQKHYNTCLDIVNQILDLAIKVSEYRSLNDGRELPEKLLREWKTLFLHGRALTKNYDVELENDKIQPMVEGQAEGAEGGAAQKEPEEDADKMEGIKLLDEKEFGEYLDGNGDWAFSGDLKGQNTQNPLLGDLVNTILEMTSPPEPPREAPQLPAVPLRLCLIGKRFAGKATLARKLAEQFGLTTLYIDALVKDAISNANISDRPTVPDTSKTKKALTKGQIGARIQLTMLEGASPDDQLLVSLVVEAIRGVPETQAHGGWVLVDFPRNRKQAELLEKELSGYEDPKPVKLGNLKRSTPKDKQQRRRSLIAQPGDTKSDGKTFISSGIDAVLMLDVDNETAVRRAVGRRIDTITGEMYHLETNPPPSDVPGIYERLVPVDDDGQDGSQLQYQLAVFEEQEELLKDWFGRFNNMQTVDADNTVEQTFDTVKELITDLANKKEKEKEEKLRDVQEAEKKTADAPAKDENTTTSTPNPDGQTQPPQSNAKDDRTGSSPDRPSGVADTAPISQQNPPSAPATSEKKPTPTKPQEDDKKGKPPSARAARGTSAGGAKTADKSGSRAPSAGQPEAGGKPRATSSQKDRAERHSVVDALKDVKRSSTPGGAGVDTAGADGGADAGGNPPLLRVTTSEGKRLPSKELALVLADQWATVESTYTDTVKFAFRSLRRERETMIRYFHNCKVNFKAFLERPDKKQALLDLFQKEFNAVEDDLRSDPDAKAELHQRTEDLREKLWDMSDVRKNEAEAERLAVIEDKWVEDHFCILVNVYITMMQAEVDRYVGTRQIVMDYYKDAYGVTITDTCKPGVKIPLVSPNATPPLDISTLFNTSIGDLHKSHRRDPGGSASVVSSLQPNKDAGGRGGGAKNAGGSTLSANLSATAAGGSFKKPALATKMASVVEIPKQFAGVAAAGGGGGGGLDREHSFIENDGPMFADLQAASDTGLSVLIVHDETVTQEKEKKDKKKGAPAEAPEEKKEPEVELPQDYHKTMESEEHLLRRKIDRIKLHAMGHLRDLRNKGLETYALLDDWIGLRFQSEMDAISEMQSIIKEAIEIEVKLPNQLVLEGERFKVDFKLLTYEPEPEPRPESPVEKLVPDQFTVLQLLNLSLHFLHLSPNSSSGTIPIKDFVDALLKMCTMSVGTELLPEVYVGADATVLQQVCIPLDPFATGYVNWRKFLMISARVLPVASVDHILYLKSAFAECESFANGKISRSDFYRISLWFEEEAEDVVGTDESSGPKFNRAAKLKAAMFYFFAIPLDKLTPRRETLASSHGSVAPKGDDFPSHGGAAAQEGSVRDLTILEESSDHGEEEGGHVETKPVAGTEQGGEGVAAGEHEGGHDVAGGGDDGQAGATTATNVDATPAPILLDPTALEPGRIVASTIGPGTHFIGEHDPLPDDSNLVFDTVSFLMCCCLDEMPKAGLYKAFYAASERADGACTLAQVYQIFHHFLVVVEETHRLGPNQNADDPYSLEVLTKLFEDAGIPPDGSITFDAFVAATESQAPTLQTCPLFQLEEITIPGVKSRPSSAIASK